MTEKDIRKHIDHLNKGTADESIFTRQISANVDVAKVWTEQPKPSNNIIGNFGSYRFFFIKDASNKYIGVVLDMYRDLHWYIMPKYRKKGYLTKALQESVLPYIFYDDRETQRITIKRGSINEENYLNSKSVATKLGFNPVNNSESEFELKKTDFDWSKENLQEVNNVVSPQRFETLKKRAFFAYKTLYKISDELLMSVDDDKELMEVAEEVKKYTWKIENLEWEQNKENCNGK
ncbi:hypothetical protein GCM10007962_11400 [Yeosuana aromativorans]|uniref:Uncharacterized protein n=1 Tax=Yeosuana aromativorans TaxID=288019 RepID=A0A8J3BG54_9FLAO|nr:GNAT family N-acetyltransferase [Yeosuana aromativorans]GGK18940.1 hypothetical protein GCM10007962_11400 [Yeosuana aromativorans]